MSELKTFKKTYEPKYKHDSECCIFVKHDVDDLDFGEDEYMRVNEEGYKGRPGDIYVCHGVVVIRYSDRPSDNRGIGMKEIISGEIERKRLTEDKEIMDAYYKFQIENKEK